MKKVSYTFLAILALLIGLYTWYTHSKTIALSINAINYQLGEAHATYSKATVVRVDGNMWRNWRGLYRFKGTIKAKGENIPIPLEHQNLSLQFDSNRRALIIYSSIENGNIIMFTLGDLYINADFSRISISKFVSEEGETNGNTKGWGAKDGFMIAGPATDRESALSVSKELMKPTLQGYILK